METHKDYYDLDAGELGLSQQEVTFCLEYIKGGCNATTAAAAAGFSKRSSHVQGCRMLKLDKIQKYIALARKDLSLRIKISSDMIALEMAKIAFSNVKRVFDETNQIRSLHELPDDVTAAIASVESEELFEGVGHQRNQIGYTKKLKMHDKMGALKGLNDMLGFNKPMKVAATDPTGEESVESKFTDEQVEKIIHAITTREA